MYPQEPVMGGGGHDQPVETAHSIRRIRPVSFFKATQKAGEAFLIGGGVFANDHGPCSQAAGLGQDFPFPFPVPLQEEFLGKPVEERQMDMAQPTGGNDGASRRRAGALNGLLGEDVPLVQQLQPARVFVFGQAGQPGFDVRQPRPDAFDQIGVVAVDHAQESGDPSSGQGMRASRQLRRGLEDLKSQFTKVVPFRGDHGFHGG